MFRNPPAKPQRDSSTARPDAPNSGAGNCSRAAPLGMTVLCPTCGGVRGYCRTEQRIPCCARDDTFFKKRVPGTEQFKVLDRRGASWGEHSQLANVASN